VTPDDLRRFAKKVARAFPNLEPERVHRMIAVYYLHALKHGQRWPLRWRLLDTANATCPVSGRWWRLCNCGIHKCRRCGRRQMFHAASSCDANVNAETGAAARGWPFRELRVGGRAVPVEDWLTDSEDS
jgi:hypothetical protein